MVDSTALQKYSLFGGLLPDDIEFVRSLMGQEGYSTGETIIVEGERNDRIRFILEGSIQVLRRGIVINEICEGEFFGEMEVLDVMPSIATIKALRPVRVATISNRALHEIYKKDTKIFALVVMNLARDLSRRLRRMDELMCADCSETEAILDSFKP